MARDVLVHPPGTSWMSVLGGWIATIGAAALVAPAVAGLVARISPDGNDIAPAVPVIVGIVVSYLIGGYVAGRMAGYRTSWHGMMTAFFSLFVLLVVGLLGYAAANGAFAGSGISSLADIVPGAKDLKVDSFGNALTFGALIGFLAAIFAGWLGGVLAPSQAVAYRPYTAGTPASPVPARGPRRERDVARPHRPFIAMFGQKGGERAEERRQKGDERPEQRHETEVDRS